jgi:heme-degrading monooxygenase HmoA
VLAPNVRVVYGLKRHWRDGASAISFDPLTFIERLAALVPPPRAHRLTCHGVLAPASAWRDLVVPKRAPARLKYGGMIEPPCYAVIFSSLRRPDSSGDGYAEMGERMLELAALQPGYLGVESARGSDGFGITVSYWSSLESIAAWRAHAEHRIAQTLGRERWYEHFELRIARVEQSRSFRAPQ